jgi:hypothetical protein
MCAPCELWPQRLCIYLLSEPAAAVAKWFQSAVKVGAEGLERYIE